MAPVLGSSRLQSLPQVQRSQAQIASVWSGRKNVPQAGKYRAQQREQEHPVQQLGEALKTCLIGLAAAASVALPMAGAPDMLMPAAEAKALGGNNQVKNAGALLRYALPIDNKNIRQIQVDLEGVPDDLRIPGSKAFGPISSSVRKANAQLEANKSKITGDFAPDRKGDGESALKKLQTSLRELSDTVESKDKEKIFNQNAVCLNLIGDIEQAMVKGFPYSVPKEYDSLPQLKGRATVDVDVKFTSTREGGLESGVLRMVLDGYNAPITAGNFLDLVNRKFYDGMEVQRADGFVVQTGNPGGGTDGFLQDGKVRKIPFEIKVAGDKAPIYGETLEDLGRFNDDPQLPFNAYGTLALARQEFEANSGSSQVFWLLKESELTPTGANLLDGRYAVFGYLIDGAALLQQAQVGDKIVSMKIVDGLQYLQQPAGAVKTSTASADAPITGSPAKS
ncbi:hypothetical protein WJX74_009402 [Apatococcus lobatus]|uniref:peptidylprolyl isomerase n=1 Tax=Apatococcus lobatus TaxID=904363 RepID=A0AAW1QJV0_9CHLO